MPSISVFFPAYNDAGSIEKLIRSATLLLPWVTDDFEIVVVDDGSVDGTADLLDRLQGEHPHLKVIHHGTNRGYGAALVSGFANCSKELIFYTDGDGQYDVNEMPRLLEAFDDNVDMVTGYKIRRSDPGYRILAGRIYRVLVRLMFGLKVRDVDCDFRLFRRRILNWIRLTCDSGVICVEMIKKCQLHGCPIVEVPVHHYHRASGQSQFFSPKHLTRVVIQLVATWFRLVMDGRQFCRPVPSVQPEAWAEATIESERAEAD